jgi:hypothetical protein
MLNKAELPIVGKGMSLDHWSFLRLSLLSRELVLDPRVPTPMTTRDSELLEILMSGHERDYLEWSFLHKSTVPDLIEPEALDEYVRLLSDPVHLHVASSTTARSLAIPVEWTPRGGGPTDHRPATDRGGHAQRRQPHVRHLHLIGRRT